MWISKTFSIASGSGKMSNELPNTRVIKFQEVITCIMTKPYLAKSVALNFLSPLPSKSSTQRKASRTSPAVALPAVPQEKHKVEVVDSPAHSAKCFPLPAPLVAKKPLFLSNLQVTNRFIAVIATNHVPETTGKNVKSTLPTVVGRVFLCLQSKKSLHPGRGTFPPNS